METAASRPASSIGNQDKLGSCGTLPQTSFIVYITRYDGFAVGV